PRLPAPLRAAVGDAVAATADLVREAVAPEAAARRIDAALAQAVRVAPEVAAALSGLRMALLPALPPPELLPHPTAPRMAAA
ncbi:hypothetical protein JYK14_13525, partial [Siccirubricoccus sp. KC 17139]